MLQFIHQPKYLNYGSIAIPSFTKDYDPNIDEETIASFGKEWLKFSWFDEFDVQKIGNDYFDLIDNSIINKEAIALDAGCGSGRWAKFLSPKVKFIEAIDPSLSVISAYTMLSSISNVRVTQASISYIPFEDNSFDFIYSLGVLHHLPDTKLGLENCVQKLKPGGWILIYLYYKLDDKSLPYRLLFGLVNFARLNISRLPKSAKHIICDIIALLVYLPMAMLSLVVSYFSESLADKLPLSYYRKTSFRIMRNDALDRFGTPIEKRFLKKEIETMMTEAKLRNIKFSNKKPFWHVIAQK